MTTFLDLIVMLFWPVVSAAAAWAIAMYALAQKDEISEVVEALTGPMAFMKNGKREWFLYATAI